MSAEILVLCVDDEPDFADVTAEYLENEADPLRVDTVSTPDGAFDRLDDRAVDCIVSDYNMPGQNGIEFLQSVRGEYPDLPFFLFTGQGSEEIASEAISAGVTDYLQKGSNPEQFTILANRIQSAVEKHRTEKELAATRRRYEKLVEQNFVGIYIIQDGEFVYVNPKLSEIHGYDRETILGMSPLELVAPEERDRVRANLQRRMEGDTEDIQYQTVGLTKEGERIDVGLHGSRIIYEGAPAVIGAELDITERKEKERQLEALKERFEAYVRNASDLITVLDGDGTVQYQSPSIERILGYDQDALEGENIFEYIHPDDADEVWKRFQAAIETPDNVVERIEYQFEHADGSWVWLESVSRTEADSTVGGYVVNSREITERKAFEQELTRQNEHLDEFATLISHDVRNPLNAAQLHLELAREECDSDSLATVSDNLDRIDTMLEDLLSLARAGEMVGDVDAVDFAKLWRQCWQTLAPASAAYEGPAEVSVRADNSRLRQLLENLIRNAVEHGGEDVTVQVGIIENGRGFYVADDGPGIPEEDRDQIFERGYSSAEDGSGYGLAIVEEIAEAHGWAIEVAESAAGGARFDILGVEFDSG